MTLISFIKKHQTLFVFIWLLLLTFFVFRKTFGLSLFGDDWLVISKYLGDYGPGGQFNYIDKSLLLTNYGPQYVGMAIIYRLFGLNSFPYYIVNLVLRALCALAIYFFAKNLFSKPVGFVSATFFALTSIGAETTNWVYNLNSYVGILLAIVGLYYFIDGKSRRESILAWSLIILGYLVVIIRLFVLPFTLFFLALEKNFSNRKNIKLVKLAMFFFKASLMFLPFLLIKYFFPGMGFQSVNAGLISSGFSSVSKMLSQGKVDWILTPFTSLGMMLFPEGLPILGRLGFVVYPLRKFILFALVLLISAIIFVTVVNNIKKWWLKLLLYFSPFLFLVLLKLIAHYQLDSTLQHTHFFVNTYVGLVLFTVIFTKIVDLVIQKKWRISAYYLTGLVFLMSFLFPWLYSPGSIMEVVHRYNIVPGVGMSLILAGLFSKYVSKFQVKFKYILPVSMLVIIMLIQASAVNRFFSLQLSIRPRGLNEKIYSQLMQELPDFPHDRESIFYFDVARPEVFGQLIGFGFPYHMQLLYNLKFDGEKYPFSVGTKNDLIKTVTDINETRRMGYTVVQTPTPIDHVFAFKLEGDKLINITPEIRKELTEIINEE